MDKKLLIKQLNQVFCDMGNHGKRYSKVWLEDETFGGLYNSGKYVLKVQALHEIDNCSDEIKDIIFHLDKVAKEELEYIIRVAIYDLNDEVHCESEDLIVYTEEDACDSK